MKPLPCTSKPQLLVLLSFALALQGKNTKYKKQNKIR